MSFIERKKAAIHKLHTGLIGRRPEVASVKYALKQLESRLGKQNVKDYPNIFYFFGPNGVGKSTVLQSVLQDCEKGELGYQPLAVWLDCRELPSSEAMVKESLIIGLARAMVELTEELLPHFKPLFQVWQQYSKEEASPMAARPTAPSPAAPQAQPAPRHNPVRNAYGTMASLPTNKNLSVKSIARNVTKNMQAMEASQRIVPQAPTRDITRELMENFVKTVDKISTTCPVIFFIDHYELIEAQDDWFRLVFLPAFQRELVVVIAGENNLFEAYQHAFGNVAACIRLKPFSRFETAQYFRYFNRLQEPQLLEAIQDLTGGIPVSLAMVSAALQHLLNRAAIPDILDFLAFPAEDYGDQLDKYIAYIALDEFPNSDKNLLAALALMRDFEPNLFQHLSGVMNIRRTLEHLSQRYPFVTAYGQMSPFVSRTLRGYFKQEQETLYEQIYRTAYDYYAEQLRNHPEELSFLVDSMFYYFHVEPRGAYTHLINLISHFLHKNLDLCDELCLVALESAIPKNWKKEIAAMAESLGAFRKKDPKGSQVVLAAISGKNNLPPQDEQFYLNYLEMLS